jgi:hypothetical protein
VLFRSVVSEFGARATAVRNKKTEQTRSLAPPFASPPKPMPTPAKSQIVDTAAAFADESEYARTLVFKHGNAWEFLLVQELVTSKLLALKQEYASLEKDRLLMPRRRFDGVEFVNWIGEMTNVLASASSRIGTCINQDLPHAMGKPGVSGDAVQILSSVNTLFSACRVFLNFDRDLYAADTPEALAPLKDAFRGMTEFAIGFLEEFVGKWAQALEGLRKGAHEFNAFFVLKAPPQLEKARVEMEKIRNNPMKYR